MAVVVAVATAAIGASASVASPVPGNCGSHGYAYAGVQTSQQAYGVNASLAVVTSPQVSHGHVAAWIGVGARGQGPHGADEWLQVGLNRVAGDTDKLYYEVAQPWGIRYVELASDIPAGRRYKVAVLEVHGWRSVWRVWVNGRPVSEPIWLPGSHSKLTPMAVAESWDGGTAVCNDYEYLFQNVSLAQSPGGRWLPLPQKDAYVMQDPGYQIVSQPGDTFIAVGAESPERRGDLRSISTAHVARLGEAQNRGRRSRALRAPESTGKAR